MRQVGADDVPTLHAEGPDGVLVAFRVHGGSEVDDARPPVLLVHGFASNAGVTWEGTGWVRALQDAHRSVIDLDLRGHGDSDKPVDADAYAPERLGRDLVAVLDSAEAEVVDVVGYSMGNRVVSALAELAPERVRRVVIGGAGPDELFASWDLDDARAVLLRDEPARNPVIEQVLRPAITAGADREALLACIEGVSGSPLVIPGDIPTLFVAGEDDPVPRGARELALDWGADFVSIPGRDHVSTLTSRAFKDAAIAFLADLPDASAHGPAHRSPAQAAEDAFHAPGQTSAVDPAPEVAVQDRLARRAEAAPPDLRDPGSPEREQLGGIVRPALGQALPQVVLRAQHFGHADELADQGESEEPGPIGRVLALLVRVDPPDLGEGRGPEEPAIRHPPEPRAPHHDAPSIDGAGEPLELVEHVELGGAVQLVDLHVAEREHGSLVRGQRPDELST